MKRNPYIAQLPAGYLFPEIARRVQDYRREHPSCDLISLGIGDTTTPLPPAVHEAMAQRASEMGTQAGYAGYPAAAGTKELREAVASRIYGGTVKADDIFMSDGSKCDAGRLAVLFGSHARVGVQDPSYPVYVDDAYILGQELVAFPCTRENGFFPHLDQLKQCDVFYLVTPHNPTGVPANREQLTELVARAKEAGCIIVSDTAYSAFVTDPDIPKSIYEIEGAEEVAIEIGSFSKMAGFTGLRLGWVVVPEGLHYDEGHPVKLDFSRIHCTLFNGVSHVTQAGGVAALSDKGWNQLTDIIEGYRANTARLAAALDKIGLPYYGGKSSPYLWVDLAPYDSWEAFDAILNKLEIITTPGAGFGPAGQGYVRLSAFASAKDIERVEMRLERWAETGLGTILS